MTGGKIVFVVKAKALNVGLTLPQKLWLHNGKLVADRDTSILNTLQTFWLFSATGQIFYIYPKETIMGSQVWWTSWSQCWSCLSVTQHRQSQGNFWWCNWHGLGCHLTWTTCPIECPAGQYPLTVTLCVPRNVNKKHHCVCRPRCVGLKELTAHINWELLLFVFSCTVWVYITQNVPAMWI